MKQNKKEIWFKAKHYGWGWYPSSWEGWLVLFGWLIVFVIFLVRFIKNLNWIDYGLIFLVTAILVLISWFKGEKPRWHWGNNKMLKINKECKTLHEDNILINEMQKEKMKELWDNKAEEVWEK